MLSQATKPLTARSTSPKRNLTVRLIIPAAILLSWSCVASPRQAETTLPETIDLVLANGRIVDGTGAPWFRGDIGIHGQCIVALGDLRAIRRTRAIDVQGHIIAPGFIDLLGQSEFNLLVDGRAESKIRQGVTTEISGEGFSAAPMSEDFRTYMKSWADRFGVQIDWTDLSSYFQRLEKSGIALNFGTFVGSGNARELVLGDGDVDPTPEQLAKMVEVVDLAMQQGAFGVSFSDYPPASYAKTPELIALAQAASRHGGIYATHMRSYGQRIYEALEETFTIAREARIPVELFHLGLTRPRWGQVDSVMRTIAQARAQGLDITADNYPYEAGSNTLENDLPEWATEDGTARSLADPAKRKRIIDELMSTQTYEAYERYAKTVLLVSSVNPELKKYMGRSLYDVARELGKNMAEATVHLVAADHQLSRVWPLKSEADVRQFMVHPWVALGIDSPAQATDGPFAGEAVHPRAFGGAARILGTYVRDLKLLTLEEAVRKMTSLPAGRLGLMDRGLLRPGMMADLVVFDPAAVRDLATYTEPLRYAEGVLHVVVNGQLVLDNGTMTSARPGRVLRKNSARQ